MSGIYVSNRVVTSCIRARTSVGLGCQHAERVELARPAGGVSGFLTGPAAGALYGPKIAVLEPEPAGFLECVEGFRFQHSSYFGRYPVTIAPRQRVGRDQVSQVVGEWRPPA